MIRSGYKKLRKLLAALPEDERQLASATYEENGCRCVLGKFIGKVPPEDDGVVIQALVSYYPRFAGRLRDRMGLSVSDATHVQYICDSFNHRDNSPEGMRARYAHVMEWLAKEAP